MNLVTTDKYKRMTNADRVRQMNNSELANLLREVKADCKPREKYPDKGYAASDWLKWLESEVD